MELDEFLGEWQLAAVADGSSEPVDARARKGDGLWLVTPKGGAAFAVPAGTPVSPDGTLRVPGWLVTTGPASAVRHMAIALGKMQGLRDVRLFGRRKDSGLDHVCDRGRVVGTGPFSFSFVGAKFSVPIPPGACFTGFTHREGAKYRSRRGDAVCARGFVWEGVYGDPPAPFDFELSAEVAGYFEPRRRP